MSFLAPAGFAVLLWWFTTGIILFLDGLPRTTFRWSMGLATVILLPTLYTLRACSGDATSSGAYAAFSCAVLVWGWIEMSFLMGFITGPRKHACVARCAGWRHFWHATLAILYNEFATAVGAATLSAATLHQPNRLALWTYLTLWVMRVSAKLNLFLGVPNLGEKFLPDHLAYLTSFFTRRSINFLFPISVTLATVAGVFLLQRYRAAQSGFELTANAVLTSLVTLALVEHWFMVLPLPSERLWSWALPHKPKTPPVSRPSKTALKAKEA